VLLLCSANLCRSPTAAALLDRRLAQRHVGATVTSAGMGPGGIAVPESVLAAARELGLDLSAHRSRTVDASLVAQADLVLGLTREHGRCAVGLDGTAWRRTFTLKELTRRGLDVGARGRHESLGAWLDEIDYGRPANALLGAARVDDVADPIGQSPRVYKRTFRELDRVTDQLAQLLAGDE